MTARLQAALPPGSVIGILGSGQLGRMAALAAHRLGYPCHIYGPEEGAPANQVGQHHSVAGYNDQAALTAFAAAVDVVTFEFENVPAESANYLASLVPVHPNPSVLATCRNRLREKQLCQDLGIGTARFAAIRSVEDLVAALGEMAAPGILKTTELGYDGKGQARIETSDEAQAVWDAVTGHNPNPEAILEEVIDFEREVSVVLARALDGHLRCFDVVENQHRNHILDKTIAPAPISAGLAQEAQNMAARLAEAMEVIGLLAVEMFVTRDGRLLVNEMAPRPHNSGHWTMDACVTDQFEQFIRAVAGLPLGDPSRHSDAEMQNLLGDEVDQWRELLNDPGAKLHLYGKASARPGRKMGHVNRLTPRSDE